MKFLKIHFIFLSFFALSACHGADEYAQNQLYPFAQANKDYQVPEAPPEGLGQKYFSVLATDNSTMRIHSWYYADPHSASRTYVIFHGNGDNLEGLHQENFIAQFETLNSNFIIIDYPGLGRSTGTPNQENLVNSGIAAIQWAKETFPNCRLIVWGHSLGAAVAVLSTARVQNLIDGLLVTSGWNNLMDVARDMSADAKDLSAEWVQANAWESDKAAQTISIPTFIHHGEKDTIIKIQFGEKLAAAFDKNNYFQFKPMPGLGHDDIISDPGYWQDIANFSP